MGKKPRRPATGWRSSKSERSMPTKRWAWPALVVTAAVSIGIAYYQNLQPDLRMSYSQAAPNAGLQVLDQQIETGVPDPLGPDSGFKLLIAFEERFTNRSLKAGWVKDVELVPLGSFGDFVDAKVIAVDRVPIWRGETKTVYIRAEIRARGRFKVNALVPPQAPGENPTLKVDQQTALDLEVRASDNVGQSITRFEDDQPRLGRLHLRLTFGQPGS